MIELSRKGSLERTWRVVPIVGNFFEELAGLIFNGQRVLNQQNGNPDIINESMELGIEVKASGSDDSLRLCLEQLEGHRSNSKGFPFSWFIYALFDYHTPRGVGKQRLLSRQKNESAIRSLLLDSVSRVYILDLEFIWKLKSLLEAKTNLRPFSSDPVIEIKRKDLRNSIALVKSDENGSSKWKVESRCISVPLPDLFTGLNLELDCVIVLSREFDNFLKEDKNRTLLRV